MKENIDIYITGSNSYMLSGELATLLTGRYVQIEMLPFPFVSALGSEQKQIREYLRSIYDTIVLKDVVGRKKITDVMMLESVIRFVADNIGNPLSTKKISDTMVSNGRSINVRTVESYLTAFMDSYIIYQAKRYEVKGKQYLKTLEKYYMTDIGLRNTKISCSGTPLYGEDLHFS